MTSVSRLAGSTWRMNSPTTSAGCQYVQRPAASRRPATILRDAVLPTVIIAAMAACSAQKPVPGAVSMQTPEKTVP